MRPCVVSGGLRKQTVSSAARYSPPVRSDIRDVAAPQLIRCRRIEPSLDQVGRHWQTVFAVSGGYEERTTG